MTTPLTPIRSAATAATKRHIPSPGTRARLPLLVAPAVVAATAVLAVLCGLATGTVLMITAAAALAAGLVAHRTGASLLAGVVLALARPFAPGERLRLDVPELGGVAEAQLLRTGLLTTTLCTGSGVLVVPNAELLRVPAASD